MGVYSLIFWARRATSVQARPAKQSLLPLLSVCSTDMHIYAAARGSAKRQETNLTSTVRFDANGYKPR
jgi:hypothetical protein